MANTQHPTNNQQDWDSETFGVCNHRLHRRVSSDTPSYGLSGIYDIHYNIVYMNGQESPWALRARVLSSNVVWLIRYLPVTRICEIYIDDLLVHGKTDDELLVNLRKILMPLRENKVTVNPDKTKLGHDEVEYAGHAISSTGTSFTPEKRLQVSTSYGEGL